MKKIIIKAGIVGASGYTGGELIRLLISHPFVNLEFALNIESATLSSTMSDL